ncbi:MAG: 6-carboxytetrahydropterin synthase [Bacteroidales bacterium]|nr:6-carboxytetrahydropterin synthase [Bacteroidales bacterium]
MTLIRLTKEFKFEMAHALLNYDGPCKNIHGHSYELIVTVIGKPVNNENSTKNGMVIDFSHLKSIVNKNIISEFDHALVLNNQIEKKIFEKGHSIFDKLIFVDYQPTSENLLIDFVKRINNKLPDNISLHSMKLRETVTSYAEWYAEDNK